MTRPDCRDYFSRLTEGCKTRANLDDPSFSLKQIFINLVLMIFNDRIIELSDDAYEVDVIEDIHVKYRDMIMLGRDWKWVNHFYDSTMNCIREFICKTLRYR